MISPDDFDVSWVTEKSLNDIMLGKEWADKDDIESILDSAGMTLEEWLEMSVPYKLSDLMGQFNYQDILGGSYNSFDKKKAIEWLNKYSNEPPISDEEEVVCPNCDADSTQISSEYNYDTGHTDYTCRNCDHTFTEDNSNI
jgi:hypothetical protein